MYVTIADFLNDLKDNVAGTQKYLDTLTDEALSQAVADGHRTLGRMAWHIVQTIPEMMGRTGLVAEGPAETEPVPATAVEIADAYRATIVSLTAQISEHWTDATLLEEDDMYGGQWSRGFTVQCLMEHETHHRGQMSILMRQAGLPVPGTMGPAKEDWPTFGQPIPEI